VSIKINLKEIINFIFSVLLVLSCNSVIYYNSDILKYVFIAFLSIFFLFNFIIKRKICKNSIFLVLLYYSLVIFYGVLMGFNLRYIYIYLITLPFLYLVYSNNDVKLMKDIFRNLLNIITILAVVSLFFYIFGQVLAIIKPSAVIINRWTSSEDIKNYIDSYYNLHYYTQYIIIGGIKLARNSGIFTETPMFALILSIGLIIEMFISEKHSLIKRIILVVAIATTLSTTAIIAALIAFFFKYISKNNNKLASQSKIIMFPIFVLIICFIGAFFMKDKMSTTSYSIRVDDYVACIKAWTNHPILGNGLFETTNIVKYMGSFRGTNQGLANSLFTLLAQGGIYFVIIYLIPVLNSIKYAVVVKNKNLLCFIMVMFVLFFTTIFQYTPFCLNFLAMAISLNINKKLEVVS